MAITSQQGGLSRLVTRFGDLRDGLRVLADPFAGRRTTRRRSPAASLSPLHPSLVERFNGELNVEVNLPFKIVLIVMETHLQILDVEDRYQLGAIQMLGVSILEHADANLVAHWDVHPVRRARGHALGRPYAIAASN